MVLKLLFFSLHFYIETPQYCAITELWCSNYFFSLHFYIEKHQYCAITELWCSRQGKMCVHAYGIDVQDILQTFNVDIIFGTPQYCAITELWCSRQGTMCVHVIIFMLMELMSRTFCRHYFWDTLVLCYNRAIVLKARHDVCPCNHLHANGIDVQEILPTAKRQKSQQKEENRGTEGST